MHARTSHAHTRAHTHTRARAHTLLQLPVLMRGQVVVATETPRDADRQTDRQTDRQRQRQRLCAAMDSLTQAGRMAPHAPRNALSLFIPRPPVCPRAAVSGRWLRRALHRRARTCSTLSGSVWTGARCPTGRLRTPPTTSAVSWPLWRPPCWPRCSPREPASPYARLDPVFFCHTIFQHMFQVGRALGLSRVVVVPGRVGTSWDGV